MLYSEIIAVCSQIHTKHINTLCGQNVEFVNVKPGSRYSNHWALKVTKASVHVPYIHIKSSTPQQTHFVAFITVMLVLHWRQGMSQTSSSVIGLFWEVPRLNPGMDGCHSPASVHKHLK
jgi:hypothetical protein